MKCHEKLPYSSKREAKAALARQHRRRPHWKGHAYHCPTCGQYHIGRKRKDLRKLA
jgi:predicted RNA-binding Zn-ribbon protein involved in translation (DUF1610 family)